MGARRPGRRTTTAKTRTVANEQQWPCDPTEANDQRGRTGGLPAPPVHPYGRHCVARGAPTWHWDGAGWIPGVPVEPHLDHGRTLDRGGDPVRAVGDTATVVRRSGRRS